MDVRNFSRNCSLQCAVLCKNAAMAIRDVLVLQICCGVDSMSYVCFKFAVESAFNITNIKDFKYTCGGQSNLDSQMHLSCNSIRSLARNRKLFDRKMEKYFGPMPAEDLNTLFAAYVRCAATASFVKSNKARPKRKRRERQTAYRPPDVCPRVWELQSDSAMLSHQYRCTSIVQSGAAESDWEPERERSVSMQCVPGGGPRVEIRQTAAEWLDSAS